MEVQLFNFILNKDYEETLKFLNQTHINPDTLVHCGKIPLLFFCEVFHYDNTYSTNDIITDIMSLFLSRGSNPNTIVDGSNAINLIVRNSSPNIQQKNVLIEKLLKYGADINLCPATLCSAVSCLHPSPEMVIFLLKNGINPAMEKPWQWYCQRKTPLKLAKRLHNSYHRNPAYSNIVDILQNRCQYDTDNKEHQQQQGSEMGYISDSLPTINTSISNTNITVPATSTSISNTNEECLSDYKFYINMLLTSLKYEQEKNSLLVEKNKMLGHQVEELTANVLQLHKKCDEYEKNIFN